MNRALLNKETSEEAEEKDVIVNPHSKNLDGQTLLHIAANQGNFTLAKKLLEQGAEDRKSTRLNKEQM